MFVLPLSLAAAVTIRVGFRLGQGSTIDAQVSARTGVGVGSAWRYLPLSLPS